MLPRKAKGRRPAYCNDQQVDKLIAMVMALAGEVQVLRERLDTTERLAGKKGLYSAADIEAFEPSEDDELEREQGRVDYLSRILWIIDQEVEGLKLKESRTQTRTEVEAIEAL